MRNQLRIFSPIMAYLIKNVARKLFWKENLKQQEEGWKAKMKGF